VPYGTAYRALEQIAHARAGELLLVHGASGGVGIAAVQVARAKGLTVIGTAGTEKGRELAMREGAHHAVDHGAPGYLEEIMRLTGGRGVDIILEMLANKNLGADLKLLAPGESRGDRKPRRGDHQPTGHDGQGCRDLRNASLEHRGAGCGFSPCRPCGGNGNGTLRPVIGAEMPLADAPRAHRAVLQPGAFGKIVLVP